MKNYVFIFDLFIEYTSFLLNSYFIEYKVVLMEKTVTIQIISDVHTEFMPGSWKSKLIALLVKADITILAGDIVNHASKLKDFLMVVKEFSDRVIYVTGNHEYYKKSTDEEYREVCSEIEGVHFLQRDRVQIEGIWFAGATLWTNIDNYAAKMMNDPFSGEEIRAKHQVDLDWLQENVQEGDVVITHHLPSLKLIHPQYKGSNINSGFASDLDEVISALKPVIWVSGHTHTPFDLMHENTRLLVNPVGYPGENKDFKPVVVSVTVPVPVPLAKSSE